MEASKLNQYLSRARENIRAVHDDVKNDRLFATGESQWDNQEQARTSQGRTSYAFNFMPGLVDPVVNAIKQAPPAIRVTPLGGEATSDTCVLIASRIRLLEQQCRAARSRMHALKCAVEGGFGVWRTVPKLIDSKWRPVTETVLYPESVYPDPDAKEPDFSDSRMVFAEVKISRSKTIRAWPDTEWAQSQTSTDQSATDDSVDAVEAWYLEEGKLRRDILVGSQVVGTDTFESDYGYCTKLPYSFVVGNWYEDANKVRHYSSVVRLARADQIAINIAENEWISATLRQPLANFWAQADAVEDFEEDHAVAHVRASQYLKVKDIAKIVPIPKNSGGEQYGALAQSHKQAMQQVAGVGLNTGATIDPVSGKSVKLQQSQAAIATYHYADSLNAAVEHDGWVYLDQLRVYEHDGSIRALLMEDGQTMSRAIFGEGVDTDGDMIPDVMCVDFSRGEYGIQISNGPSYGSQLEQMQDLLAEVMKIPAMAPMVPVLMTLLVRRMAIPESDSIVQALLANLPPNIQALLAAKGNKDAIIAQGVAQTQQLQAHLQQCQQQMQQMQMALQQNQQLLQMRAVTNQQDNQTEIQLKQMDIQNQQTLRQMDINARLLEIYAKEQAPLVPGAPGSVVPFVPPQFQGRPEQLQTTTY